MGRKSINVSADVWEELMMLKIKLRVKKAEDVVKVLLEAWREREGR